MAAFHASGGADADRARRAAKSAVEQSLGHPAVGLTTVTSRLGSIVSFSMVGREAGVQLAVL